MCLATPYEYQGPAVVTAPPATMGYKVYVVLTTGNEKGSNAVSITRDDGLPPPP